MKANYLNLLVPFKMIDKKLTDVTNKRKVIKLLLASVSTGTDNLHKGYPKHYSKEKKGADSLQSILQKLFTLGTVQLVNAKSKYHTFQYVIRFHI